MKLSLLILLCSILLFSCQEETKTQSVTTHASSMAHSNDKTDSMFEKDKDESCDTEEDLEKKIKEAAKKKEAFSLQGADTGCATE